MLVSIIRASEDLVHSYFFFSIAEINSVIFVTSVLEEKGSELNFDHRTLNLVIVGLNFFRGLILFQIKVGMAAMNARLCWFWLYFHTGVTVLLMLPARIEEKALVVVLLMRTCLANKLIVSLPPILWLPRVSLEFATGLPVTLFVSSLIIISQVAVFFF